MCSIESWTNHAVPIIVYLLGCLAFLLTLQEKFFKSTPARRQVTLFIQDLFDASFKSWTELTRWLSKRIDTAFNRLLGRNYITRKALVYAFVWAVLWTFAIAYFNGRGFFNPRFADHRIESIVSLTCAEFVALVFIRLIVRTVAPTKYGAPFAVLIMLGGAYLIAGLFFTAESLYIMISDEPPLWFVLLLPFIFVAKLVQLGSLADHRPPTLLAIFAPVIVCVTVALSIAVAWIAGRSPKQIQIFVRNSIYFVALIPSGYSMGIVTALLVLGVPLLRLMIIAAFGACAGP